MTLLTWNTFGTRRFETGIDKGVLYIPGSNGLAWNGLVSVNEAPDGGAVSSFYQDGKKYADFVGTVDYKAAVEAFTYPDEFERCLGVQPLAGGAYVSGQRPSTFGFSYRTRIGNDLVGTAFAYKLHIVYGCTAAPYDRSYKTIGEVADPDTFSFDISAVPVAVTGRQATAHFILDSRYTNSAKLALVEERLYGSSDTIPHLPVIDDIVELLVSGSTIIITDNGDGTWSATGPHEYVYMTGVDTFQIDEANSTVIDADNYSISNSP